MVSNLLKGEYKYHSSIIDKYYLQSCMFHSKVPEKVDSENMVGKRNKNYNIHLKKFYTQLKCITSSL